MDHESKPSKNMLLALIFMPVQRDKNMLTLDTNLELQLRITNANAMNRGTCRFGWSPLEETMSRIIRFEIHATRPQALIEFYTVLLGWKFSKVGSMEYWSIETGPSGQPGINGGLVQRPCAAPGETPALNAFVCTAEVALLDEIVSKAIALGAIIALPKMSVPRMGWLAYIKDPDRNVLGLLQPDERAV